MTASDVPFLGAWPGICSLARLVSFRILYSRAKAVTRGVCMGLARDGDHALKPWQKISSFCACISRLRMR